MRVANPPVYHNAGRDRHAEIVSLSPWKTASLGNDRKGFAAEVEWVLTSQSRCIQQQVTTLRHVFEDQGAS